MSAKKSLLARIDVEDGPTDRGLFSLHLSPKDLREMQHTLMEKVAEKFRVFPFMSDAELATRLSEVLVNGFDPRYPVVREKETRQIVDGKNSLLIQQIIRKMRPDWDAPRELQELLISTEDVKTHEDAFYGRLQRGGLSPSLHAICAVEDILAKPRKGEASATGLAWETNEDICKRCGASLSYVEELLTIRMVSAVLYHLVGEGRIKVKTAKAVADLPEARRVPIIETMAEQGDKLTDDSTLDLIMPDEPGMTKEQRKAKAKEKKRAKLLERVEHFATTAALADERIALAAAMVEKGGGKDAERTLGRAKDGKVQAEAKAAEWQDKLALLDNPPPEPDDPRDAQLAELTAKTAALAAKTVELETELAKRPAADKLVLPTRSNERQLFNALEAVAVAVDELGSVADRMGDACPPKWAEVPKALRVILSGKPVVQMRKKLTELLAQHSEDETVTEEPADAVESVG